MSEQLKRTVRREEETAGDGPDIHTDPAHWAPRLHRLLEEQRGLARQIEDMGLRQSGLIAEGKTEAVLGLLAERGEMIDRLSRAAEQFEAFRSRWDELMATLPEVRRAEFTHASGELAGAIQRISERDEADRQALTLQRNAVSEELASISRGRSALSAYGPPKGAGSGARFQDRKG